MIFFKYSAIAGAFITLLVCQNGMAQQIYGDPQFGPNQYDPNQQLNANQGSSQNHNGNGWDAMLQQSNSGSGTAGAQMNQPGNGASAQQGSSQVMQYDNTWVIEKMISIYNPYEKK